MSYIEMSEILAILAREKDYLSEYKMLCMKLMIQENPEAERVLKAKIKILEELIKKAKEV